MNMTPCPRGNKWSGLNITCLWLNFKDRINAKIPNVLHIYRKMNTASTYTYLKIQIILKKERKTIIMNTRYRILFDTYATFRQKIYTKNIAPRFYTCMFREPMLYWYMYIHEKSGYNKLLSHNPHQKAEFIVNRQEEKFLHKIESILFGKKMFLT